MLTRDLKARISTLRRRAPAPAQARPARTCAPAAGPSQLSQLFPEGTCRDTARGHVFVSEVSLRGIHSAAERLIERYLAAFERAAELAAHGGLPPGLECLASVEPPAAALIDTETAGFHGRPLFLIGLAGYRNDDFLLTQCFARDYAEEGAVLAEFARLLPTVELLISFNGKAFDWPFVRDRMVYHRLSCRATFSHIDLLHLSRRRWRSRLPNCKLQTLERYLCGRWRSSDIPGEEIPQRYHEFVRAQDARLIAPVFHHNRMDLITMAELLPALLGLGEPTAKGV